MLAQVGEPKKRAQMGTPADHGITGVADVHKRFRLFLLLKLPGVNIFDLFTQRGPRLFGDMPQTYLSGVPTRGREESLISLVTG